MRKQRIGVYSGTFDPVHSGHISFALQAIEQGELDEVIFLPERKPRFKTGSEHFGHRVAMLNRAVRPHRKLSVLELTDRNFTIRRTLPELRRIFPNTDIVFLIGSDILPHVPSWPDAERLLKTTELVVGVRGDEPLEWVRQRLDDMPVVARSSTVIRSHAPAVSSGRIRSALRRNHYIEGILPSVHRYASQNWLYTSVISM